MTEVKELITSAVAESSFWWYHIMRWVKMYRVQNHIDQPLLNEMYIKEDSPCVVMWHCLPLQMLIALFSTACRHTGKDQSTGSLWQTWLAVVHNDLLQLVSIWTTSQNLLLIGNWH